MSPGINDILKIIYLEFNLFYILYFIFIINDYFLDIAKIKLILLLLFYVI